MGKDCTFSVDKAGLLGGEAVSHLSQIHKVTAEAMMTAPRGYYKYKQVKAEASVEEKGRERESNEFYSEASIPKNRETRFCCPLKDCTFTTDRAGLQGGEAASHISKIHKVTAEIMKNAPKGYHKFKKVKVEART